MTHISEHRLLFFVSKEGPASVPSEPVNPEVPAENADGLGNIEKRGEELVEKASKDEANDTPKITPQDAPLTPDDEAKTRESPEFKKLQEEVKALDQYQAQVRQEVDSDPEVRAAIMKIEAYSVLTRTHHVDPARVKNGVMPATYYDDKDIDGMVLATGLQKSRYTAGKEVHTANGKEYPKTILADDPTYRGQRTIDLHTDSYGYASYRSFRHVWDMKNILHSIDTLVDRVDVADLVKRDKESGAAQKFNEEQKIRTEDVSIDTLQKTDKTKLYTDKMELVLQKLPPGLRGRAYEAVMKGMEFREDESGNFLVCFKGDENSALFRHYWDSIFAKHSENDILGGSTVNYSDGYAVSTRPDVFLDHLEMHITLFAQ